MTENKQTNPLVDAVVCFLCILSSILFISKIITLTYFSVVSKVKQSTLGNINLFADCVGYRRRCCIVGWSLKFAWRTSLGLWSCLQQGRKNPALRATPATTTATTPPVCPAHLERTLMAPMVNLLPPAVHTSVHTWHVLLPRHRCCVDRNGSF